MNGSLLPECAAVSDCNTTSYIASTLLDAAEGCQNGIDCEPAALDCVFHAVGCQPALVDCMSPIDESRLAILKLQTCKSRCRTSRCRLETSRRWLQISHRRCETHKRPLRTRNFKNVSLQAAISDFISCLPSCQSIPSAHQTVTAAGEECRLECAWRPTDQARVLCRIRTSAEAAHHLSVIELFPKQLGAPFPLAGK